MRFFNKKRKEKERTNEIFEMLGYLIEELENLQNQEIITRDMVKALDNIIITKIPYIYKVNPKFGNSILNNLGYFKIRSKDKIDLGVRRSVGGNPHARHGDSKGAIRLKLKGQIDTKISALEELKKDLNRFGLEIFNRNHPTSSKHRVSGKVGYQGVELEASYENEKTWKAD